MENFATMATKSTGLGISGKLNVAALERWLDRDPSLAAAIAVRAALRVLPLTFEESSVARASLQRKLLLQIFRATFVVCTACRYPQYDLRSFASAASGAVDNVRADGILIPLSKKPNRGEAVASHAETDIRISAVAGAVAYAARAVSDTAHASVRAASAAGHAADAAIDADPDKISPIWRSIYADMAWIEGIAKSPQASGLIEQQLWLDDNPYGGEDRIVAPFWVFQRWEMFKNSKVASASEFDVWIRWYDSILVGREDVWIDQELKGESEQGIILKIARQRKSFWHRGANAVSADIRSWIEDAKKKPERVATSPTRVPEIRPAAIEPSWHDGRLILPDAPLQSGLDATSLVAAIEALREELNELADDVKNIQNLDQRPAEYLRRLAGRIPNTVPPQTFLFRLGHAQEVLDDFAKTTDVEWPELLASRYRKLLLQYDRTMRQFPAWRAFKRNAADSELNPEQIAEVPDIVEAVVAELKTDAVSEVIEPAIPRSLEEVARPIVDWEGMLRSGQEQLADDLLESINNILKRLAELALALKASGIDPIVSWAKGTAEQSAQVYSDKARKSLVKEFGKMGDATGPALGRLLKRLAKVVTYGTPSIGGSAWLLPRLVANYPDKFGWLEPILRSLNLL
jgi:hypothetical protein